MILGKKNQLDRLGIKSLPLVGTEVKGPGTFTQLHAAPDLDVTSQPRAAMRTMLGCLSWSVPGWHLHYMVLSGILKTNIRLYINYTSKKKSPHYLPHLCLSYFLSKAH